MKTTIADVITVVLGSSASLILAAGATPKRKALPHATVAIHHPRGRRVPIIAMKKLVKARKLQRVRKTIVELYEKNTNQPFQRIPEDRGRKLYMSATETQAYGIVDYVVKSRKKKTLLEK